MYFESFSAAIVMEGHGVFVWSAYGLTAVALIMLLWLPSRRFQQHWRWIEADKQRLAASAAKPGDATGGDR